MRGDAITAASALEAEIYGFSGPTLLRQTPVTNNSRATVYTGALREH